VCFFCFIFTYNYLFFIFLVGMLEILLLPSIDASQTAFADKRVFVSERTIYKWKNMLRESSFSSDTTPLIGLMELSNQIESHRADDDPSSDEATTNYRAKWRKWKSALSSMCSSFSRKKNALLPPTV